MIRHHPFSAGTPTYGSMSSPSRPPAQANDKLGTPGQYQNAMIYTLKFNLP
ncbi:hypothetical protein [uncultured Halomonas sp.]|uniref:hypothetical protein n=1 Tax=uncultured Halomonas sp. TaxID=173971 RepID=UPI002616DC97|nr:hypothetical protein [uncultured Halomonas sp.]